MQSQPFDVIAESYVPSRYTNYDAIRIDIVSNYGTRTDNRTSPYLWIFAGATIVPAVLFWNNTPVLVAFTLLFVATYVSAYLMIVRFKVPRWLRP